MRRFRHRFQGLISAGPSGSGSSQGVNHTLLLLGASALNETSSVPAFPGSQEKVLSRGGQAWRKQKRILGLSKILEVALKMLDARLRKLGLLSVEQKGGCGAASHLIGMERCIRIAKSDPRPLSLS